jgi:hypothetical protein
MPPDYVVAGSKSPDLQIFNKNERRNRAEKEGKNEKGRASLVALPLSFSFLCPEQESNLHYLAITRF